MRKQWSWSKPWELECLPSCSPSLTPHQSHSLPMISVMVPSLFSHCTPISFWHWHFALNLTLHRTSPQSLGVLPSGTPQLAINLLSVRELLYPRSCLLLGKPVSVNCECKGSHTAPTEGNSDGLSLLQSSCGISWSLGWVCVIAQLLPLPALLLPPFSIGIDKNIS